MTTTTTNDLDSLGINTIRALCMDAVQKANSGHPGLRNFRQLGSRCPFHPEYRWTSRVETTTGPLGQAVATTVGMAIAGAWLARRYNRDDYTLFDFDVFALAGDGCMMEGIASEAASLAGHLGLSRLCWIYDSNRVTIEGHTDIAFTEDVAARFIAYGWNVATVADANHTASVERAFHTFKAETERPTLVVVHSHIGYGSPAEDTPKAHGEPLGVEGVKERWSKHGVPSPLCGPSRPPLSCPARPSRPSTVTSSPRPRVWPEAPMFWLKPRAANRRSSSWPPGPRSNWPSTPVRSYRPAASPPEW